MQNRGITVAQLNNYIKAVFDAEEMLHNIEVIGEVSSAKMSGNNLFFTLKDDEASVSCTWFGGKIIKDGTKVVARGRVSYWNKAGKISFIVNRVEEFGLGKLMQLFQELQAKLKAEGLFDVEKKKRIPDVVNKLGVVTAKSGAVIHDIVTVARRRNPSINIALVDTHVQGVGADVEIARAIELMQKVKPDVIIVCRGGGSVEDLAPYNTETVARAVFASSIPIVSAVGHESDFTLIDFVADLRAATPSAAAEICVREVVTDRERILASWGRLKSVVALKVDRAMAVDNWVRLKHAVQTRFTELDNRLAIASTAIEAKNPIAILKRGFAKPNVELNLLKNGEEFELMFATKTGTIRKGVAEWKRLKN